jgi:hypothetical protein
MKGRMLIVTPTGSLPIKELDRYPDVEIFQKAVGGYIELIPYFNTIEWEGVLHQCFAFCDEQGKLKGKELNTPAIVLWKLALDRANRRMNDHLVGTIAIVWGDRKFMEEM